MLQAARELGNVTSCWGVGISYNGQCYSLSDLLVFCVVSLNIFVAYF